MISQEEIDVMMDMENEPIGITPEMMGAVVKGGEWHEEDSTTDKFIVAGRSYNQGLEEGRDEAWETAKKILCMTENESTQVFGDPCMTVFGAFTASEAIEKLKAYEEEQSIKVGDEILDNRDEIGVVTEIGENFVSVLYANGHSYGVFGDNSKLRKTGRHFDAISEVLEQMKKDPLAEDIEACMQGMPSDEIARLFAEG